MKANLFAVFCIALLALSLPQAFAQSDVSNDNTEIQNTSDASNETPVIDTPVTLPEKEETVEVNTETVEPAPEDQVASNVETDNKEIVQEEQIEQVAPAETEAPTTTEVKVEDSQEPVVEEKQEETPAATETKVEEPVVEDNQQEVVVPTESEQEPTETTTEAKTEDTETDKSGDEAVSSSEEVAAEPTTAPVVDNTETVTPVAEPVTPAPATETTGDNANETTGTDNQENVAPVAEEKEVDEKGAGIFAILSKVLIGLVLVSFIILVGCVYNYRYQMRKYKIAPFTPPSFLPECLFPKMTASSSSLVSGYTELQVGNYQAAPRFAEI